MARTNSKTLGLIVLILGIGAAVVLGLVGLPGDRSPDAGPPTTGEASDPAESRPSGPTDSPRSIPSVRDWRPEQGPGWAPAGDTRVVADPEGPLAAEAERLAGELDVTDSAGPAEPGDIELKLSDEGDVPPEGYGLTTSSDRVTIEGSTAAGVFYGTRTLLSGVRDQGGMPEGMIEDAPDRPQRGLMLDIARKHYPADWIEGRLREMADLKLNQLQLHFSDDQAFRIESETHPRIVSDPHLTKDEVRGIVELAQSLHITVIPEIDSPGHLGAVLETYPDLQLHNDKGEPVRGAIDISNPRAGELVDELLREYTPLFPGPYWHLGGDEYGAMYASDPDSAFPGLAEVARAAYGDDAGVSDLATAWLNDRAATAHSLERVPQVWNDGMHQGGVVSPSEDREVTYWTGKEIGAREPLEYLEEGYQLVNLNSEYLYYVLGEPLEFTYPTGERIYREWTADVLRGEEPVPDAQAGPERISGGRFAIWGDIADAQTIDEVADGIRMPLTALAQKLWDPGDPPLNWEEFTQLAERTRG